MLTAKQIAQRLNLSPRFIYDLAARGVLPCHRFGGSVRFAEADVEAYIASCKVVVRQFPKVAGKPAVMYYHAGLDRFVEKRALPKRGEGTSSTK